jgi:hypothetical protein
MQLLCRKKLNCATIAISIALTVFSTTPIWGQAVYGSIYGQVTDNTGAAVQNASITVTDVAKGTSLQVSTNEAGEYAVQHLIPDVYNVSVAMSGFKKQETPEIRVSADTSAKVDFKLEIGSATESITVTAEPPQLKSDRADVALVLNQKTVSDLPNLGRNFASLEMLIPGTQVMGWSQNAAEDPQGSPTVQVLGQHFSGVEYELDGAVNQDPILGQIVINPPLDSVGEAKISTQSYDAQFGGAVAAVVTAQTKSGTNSFHGDIFEYRHTDATLAKNPYNQFGNSLPSAKYNQFGASIGGPVIKNKLFFFADYQGTRQILGSSATATVPTKLAHDSCLSGNGCDLSDYLGVAQAYNPRTGGTAFANNFIAPQYVSSQALALLQMLPEPNTGSANAVVNNYAGSGSGKQHNDTVDVRVDDQVSETKHAFGRYSIFNNGVSSNTIFGAAGGQGFASPTNSFGGIAEGRSQSAVVGMDIAISPTFLTDFRLGYLRYHVKTSKYSNADLGTQANIPGLNIPGQPFTDGPPGFFFGNPDNLSAFGASLHLNACNCPLLETEDQYQLVNNWTKVVGTHSFKFGPDFRYARNLRVPSDWNRSGELTFGSSDTANPGGVGGLSLASFLLGDVTNFFRYVSSSTNAKESQKRFFVYGEDNWRVSPKLTLNYGVRWELYFPETVNGKGQGGLADLTSGNFRVAGYGGLNTAMNVSKTWKTIAPRLGLAYQLNPKTVIRAGYGRDFDIGVFGSIFGHVVTQNLPVLANQNLTSSGPETSAFNLSTGPAPFVFPSIPSNGLIPIPDGDSAKVRTDPNLFPTVDAWNAAVQRQLTQSMSLTVGYVGNKGTHVFSGDGQTVDANQPQPCLNGLCWNTSSTPPPNTTNNSNLLRPYFAKYGWTQGITYYLNGFDSKYNALQVTLDQRFSQGLQFTATYAYQKAYNYQGEYYLKQFDYGRNPDVRDSQLTLFGVYQLPFGRKRQFANDIPGWMDYVVGGWQLSTSLNWASGLPFTVNDYANCGSTIPAGPCRPDHGSGSFPFHLTSMDTAGCHCRTYFTPPGLGGVFQLPAVDHVGNVSQGAYSGPATINDDMSLSKTFPIHESVALEFRMDAFNAFNRINPGNPSTCIDCGPTGGGVINGMALGTQPRQLQFAATIKF